ncbi:MAG: protease modulator HflK [Planctomycetota bacterium]
MSDVPPHDSDDSENDRNRAGNSNAAGVNDGFVPPPVPPRPKQAHRFSMSEGLRAGSRMIAWLALGLFILFWCSGITTIGPGEVGLVLRCGRLTGASPADQVRQPGLLLALPYPIDEVIRVPVQQEREIAVSALRNDVSVKRGMPGYALSGNQNILEADLTVKYRITDPIAHTFRNRDPSRILRDTVIGAAVEVIAQWHVDDALRLQRATDLGPEKLASAVLREAQPLIDQMNLGVELTAIEFREVQPPSTVADAFQAVQSERIAIETKKREAEGYASRIVPAAEAESNSLIQRATRQATDLRTRADEEVALFEQVHDEYVRNPRLVWNRLHLETMEGLMRDGGQFRFVDPGTRLVLTPSKPNRKGDGDLSESSDPMRRPAGNIEVQP